MNRINRSFRHGGRLYSAPLGLYLYEGQLMPILIADADRSGTRFVIDQEPYRHALFDFPAAPSLLGEQEPQSFQEAAARALDGNDAGSVAYDLAPGRGLRLEKLVGHGQFCEFAGRLTAEPQVPKAGPAPSHISAAERVQLRLLRCVGRGFGCGAHP